MSERISRGNTPPLNSRHRRVKVGDPRPDTTELIEYPMRPLSDEDYALSRQSIKFACERIKANGGKCGYEAIDRFANRDGSGWAKKLLKASSRRKWSYNEAKELSEAVGKCENARVTETLCRINGGISERELQRRYNDWRGNVIAGSEMKTGEVVYGVALEFGGPLAYDEWLICNADRDTHNRLIDMQQGLLCRQVWAAKKPRVGAPYVCAMLYEPDAAHALASELARYLVEQNVIHGAAKEQYQLAYDSLAKLFADPGEDGPSFQDRCRAEFWFRFRRCNIEEAVAIERRMSALNENMGQR